MSILSVHNNFMANNVGRHMIKTGQALNKNIEKLSSGFRINTADDGPADLIESEKLRSQIAGLEKSIQNATTSRDVMSIAEGGLGQIQNILQDMKKYALHALNSGVTSKDQIAADQAMIDAGMAAIDRILGTTSYAGRKLLDNLNTGVTHSYDSPASPKKDGENTANVVSTPKKYLEDRLKEFLNSGTMSDGSLPLLTRNSAAQLDDDGNTIADTVFTIKGYNSGEDGYQSMEFSAGTHISEVVQKLKEFAIPQDELDKLAEVEAAEAAEAAATEAAAESSEATDGPDETDVDGLDLAEGDMFGRYGRVGDDVNNVEMNTKALKHLQSLTDEEAAEYLAGFMQNFVSIDDMSQLGEIDPEGRILSNREKTLLQLSDALMNMTSNSIGGITVENDDGTVRTYNLADVMGWGSANLSDDPAMALRVIDQAIKDIASQRATIGAAQRFSLDSMIENYQTQLINLTATESYLRDTDFASEMTDYTKNQVLYQAGTSLMKAAMQQGQQILDLLG